MKKLVIYSIVAIMMIGVFAMAKKNVKGYTSDNPDVTCVNGQPYKQGSPVIMEPNPCAEEAPPVQEPQSEPVVAPQETPANAPTATFRGQANKSTESKPADEKPKAEEKTERPIVTPVQLEPTYDPQQVGENI